MLYTDIKELEKLEAGDHIYVIVTPQLALTHDELDFNFHEDLDVSKPVYEFKKTKSKELKFIRVDNNHKKPIIKNNDIIDSIIDYNTYTTHYYMVFDSKREALKEWCMLLDNLHQNTKKCLDVVKKFKGDALSTDCIIEYINEYPEDLI